MVFATPATVIESTNPGEVMMRSAKNLMLALVLSLQCGWLGGIAVAMSCDADHDGDIDRDDLTLIQQATLKRLPVTGPDDPRDADGNGLINSSDGRICALRCTRPSCATNTIPTARAGADQTVRVGQLVVLDGSNSSDSDGQMLTYAWSIVSRPAGSSAALSVTNAVKPSVLVDRPGTYVFRLIVNDSIANSAPDEVVVSTVNSSPVANAGADQATFTGRTATLDGSASNDVDGDSLTYAWSFASRPTGSAAVLAGADTVSPTFVADVFGVYRVQLQVSDGVVTSAPDEVVVSLENTVPVANAGRDQNVVVGQTFTLDGSGSTDIDGQALSYSWAFLSRPVGSQAALSNTAAVKPTFIVDTLGTYVVQLIVNDGLASSVADTVVVTSTNVKPVANAGPDQGGIFAGNTVQLDGRGSHDVDGQSLSFAWSIISAPAGSVAALSNSTAIRPTFVADRSGTYVIQLIVNDGYENSVPDQVVVTTENRAPISNAGPDQSVAFGQTVMLDGSASGDPDGAVLTYAWSFVSRPVGSAATLSNSISVSPTFVADRSGDYVLQLVVNDGLLSSAPDTVTISTLNVKPVANAGPDQLNVLVGDTVTLNGSASSDANFDPLTYSWSFTVRPSGSSAVLNGATTAAATFLADSAGTYLVQLIVNDGKENSLPDSTIVEVKVRNTAPVANADSYTVNQDAILAVGAPGVLANDTDAEHDTLTAELVTPPASGILTLNTDGSVTYSPAANFSGTVTFTYRASDGKLNSAPATVTITVTPVAQNTAPTATADAYSIGENQTLNVASPGVLANDSDAQHDPLTAELVSSTTSGGLTLQANGGFTYTPNLGFAGVDHFSYRARDAVLPSAPAIVEIVVTPQVNALPLDLDLSVAPQVVPVGGSVAVTVAFRGGQGTATRTLNVDGVPVALDALGKATVTNVSSGVHRVVATVADVLGSVSKEGYFSGQIAGDATPPTVAITAPVVDTELYGPVDIVGTATDSNLAGYRLLAAPSGTMQFAEFAHGTTPVVNGALGRFDITTLNNGLYDILLEATDANGAKSQAMVTVEVIGDQKVGNFDITFEDLSVEAVGIPIRVTRTYSTRRKAEALDFGYGWSVGYQDLQIRKNMVLGLSWNVVKQGFNLCLRPAGKRKVSITLPDGKLERFEAKNATDCAFAQVPDVSIQFTALAGTNSTLEAINIPSLIAQGGQIYDMDNFGPWNPTDFKLTTEDGTQYYLKEGVGITQIKDPYGNTMTYGASGILHSNGQSVAFQRDSQGRITRVTDPSGKAITYAYNVNGDLASVTNRNGETSYFRYNRSHGLVDFTDPRGMLVLRNVYDNDGKLIEQYDAAGNKVAITHDTASQKEVVKNRRGYATTYTYNAQGDVTEILDALSQTTRYTYDALGNETSTTDPLGHITTRTFDPQTGNQLNETDPLGHTISYGYDSIQKTQLKSLTDPNGNVTNYSYFGPAPSQIAEPLGRTTTLGYDSKGNLLSLNFAGNATTYGYDAKGHRTSETDAAGNQTTYTFDADGREIARTYSRTNAVGVKESITLTRLLDSEGRVLEETDALGGITRTSYNTAGKPTQVTDAQGRVTTYTYDAQARLIKTVYPDGTWEGTDYDANGNEVQKTDRAGRVTRHDYDALDRLVKVTYPDGSSEATEYDGAGRVSASVDPKGSRTANTYDAAGRLTETLDPAGGKTSDEYDANGNRTKTTDPQGRITVYQYDALNRLTQTTLPGGTTKTTVWRADGRKSSETDEAGNTTTYGYDALGRLAQVKQTLQGGDLFTAYGYDELGNKTSQTDAEGRITRWAYDKASRPISRTLPNGETETFQYDAAGNRIAHIDFAGRKTQAAFDANNRPTLILKPDSTTLSFTYSPTGQVETVTDARGTTKTTYDALDRVTRQDNPDGSFVAYAYDPAGNIVERSSPQGTTHYAYDANGRISQVTDPQNKTTAYTWNAANQSTKVQYPNGTETRFEYDQNGRVKQQAHLKTATLAVITATRYTVVGGLRTKVETFDDQSTAIETNNLLTLANPAAIKDYAYDALSRLTGETLAVRGSADMRTTTFVYDKVGNRKQKTVTVAGGTETTNYSYDTDDRLTLEAKAVGGSTTTTTYAWDANGSLSKKVTSIETILYGWDSENHLVEVKRGATEATAITVATYVYDADGNRVKKTEPATGKVTDYLVDSSFPFAQVVEEKTTQSGVTETAHYVWGIQLIKQIRGGQGTYYHADALGSVKALTDPAGNVTDLYEYEAFGELASHAGTTTNPYRYTGEHYDDTVMVQYNRARWYEAGVGRWMALDDFAGSQGKPATLNKYAYAGNEPVANSDPSGAFSMGEMSATMDIIGIQAVGALARYQISDMIGNALMSPLVDAAMNFLTSGRSISFGNPGAAGLLTVFAVQCRLTKKCYLRKIPVLVNGIQSPETSAHILDSIMGNGNTVDEMPRALPFLLLKGPTGERNDVPFYMRRASAQCNRDYGGKDCDEYPYASTLMGGKVAFTMGQVSLRLVPRSDNRRQGAKLVSFYNAAGVGPGKPFINLSVPYMPMFYVDKQGVAHFL
jgi:RHS repeat-associated protein